MDDFLSFNKMITPVIIKFIFWIGAALCVLAGLVMIVGGVTRFGGGGLLFMGLLYLFVGPLLWRVYCELLIVIFRILDELTAIRHQLVPPPGQGFPVMPITPAPPQL